MLANSPRLTTGTAQDPLLPKLLEAIYQATDIEIAVSFIQPSGLELLFDPLLEALNKGASIRLLTSDYLNITHPRALRELLMLAERGAQVRVFECTGQTSFHLKSYIFTQNKNAKIIKGSAFIGSNNISRTALTHAYEWSWRHDWQPPEDSSAAQEFVKIRHAFAQLFDEPSCVSLTADWIDTYSVRRQINLPLLAPISGFIDENIEQPSPNSVQVEALQALLETRTEGFSRGLVVLATGMGKTWLAAFDALQMQAKRVLFVAHREEILLQAQSVFNRVHPNAHTGLFQGALKEHEADFVFASVQSLSKPEALQRFSIKHFDYIVVDEFHHASAPSYRSIIKHFNPQFLLGLTATPERTDQADILSLCDNNLVFERNLVHGINAQLLAPIHYYGIYDEYVDYQEIPWRSGRFEPAQIEFAFATQKRAKHIYQHWLKHKQTRTLGFCISQKHADYMSQYFQQQGVRAGAVYAGSQLTRHAALSQLAQGQLEVIFSVDMFNEGTDLPALDTVLMLRPTESKIIFLQQLGRGLRLSQETNKTHVVVLDFLGNHHSFLNSPAALLGEKDRNTVLNTIRQQQPIQLAEGCFINFAPKIVGFWEKLARKIGSTAAEDYQQLRDELGHRPTATEFFHKGYDLAKMRKQAGSWLALVAKQEEDALFKQLLSEHGEFFAKGVETTSMNKSFKGFLYQAFLDLSGVQEPVATTQLAKRSRQLLEHRPDDLRNELPQSIQQASAESRPWLSYWRKNPIFYSCQQDKNSSQAWFIEHGNSFALNFTVTPELQEIFADYFQELIDLRLAQYFARKKKSKQPYPVKKAEILQAAEESKDV
ncbi:DEAD/DEAH box helicase family protein [Thiopseudomonas acetoxidans]|uniref:DEAD/DEAH box helicase family protein n=1 Tax=Thiopseudomonas acetoxidans TaxID=3041622 RepID=A0ABT7SMD5_9GAMM|nr:DEAD/DEAH box helicase family protein [Thiopseudomonas sp. CY1220]MDM7857353.1 DEAD/DEAH box helicase family protein [Thiopseudomonas sp. CY1220]